MLFSQHLKIKTKKTLASIHTFGESQLLGDRACDLGSSGVTVEVDLIHAVPVHVCPAKLQAVDGWPEAGKEETVNQGERRVGGAKEGRVQLGS